MTSEAGKKLAVYVEGVRLFSVGAAGAGGGKGCGRVSASYGQALAAVRLLQEKTREDENPGPESADRELRRTS